MPLQVGSRYSFCFALTDSDGRMFLTERTPYGYAALADTRTHAVVSSDTLFSLAAKYFAPLPRACGFFWAIADFQPDPILDPTPALDIGRIVYIPSTRVLTDVILGESRRRTA
jgi:hypothetical protein